MSPNEGRQGLQESDAPCPRATDPLRMHRGPP